MPKFCDTAIVRRKDIAHWIHLWAGLAAFDGTGQLALFDAEMWESMRGSRDNQPLDS